MPAKYTFLCLFLDEKIKAIKKEKEGQKKVLRWL